MSRHTTILLVLIVLAPLALVTVLGARLVSAESAATAHRFASVQETRLVELATRLDRVIAEIERHLARLADTTVTDPEGLRELGRGEPRVRQAFLLDREGRLVFPEPMTATSREAAFLERTAGLWREKRPLFAAGENGEQESRWLTWFHGRGPVLLHTRRLADGRAIGFEVERVALISDLVAALPTTARPTLPAEGRIELVDGLGATLHVSGVYTPAVSEAPLARVPLGEPLGAWSLRLFAPGPRPGTVDRGLLLGWGLGLAALTLALAALAVVIGRELSRSAREARRRVDFVSQVSHELKTPLTNIRLYAELIAESLDDEETRAHEQVAVIVSESQRLGRLIGNVLSFARAQRGVLTLSPSPGCVDDTVREVVAHFRPAFARRGVAIELDLDAPAHVLVDGDAVGQVLGNLLSNIEKYAAAGRLARVVTRQDGARTTIRVEDRGPGIPLEARERIFAPFVRLSDRITDGATGTGIGLAIARDLARAHGGDLSLEPSASGACFEAVLATARVTGEEP